MAFELIHYSQQDPQWKNNKIGGGPDTIGYVGCALTSVAMYASGWGFTETPGTLNTKLTAKGGFINEAIVWSAISSIYPQIQSNGLTVCTTTDAPLTQIDNSLAAGQPVIVEVDFSPAPGLQTHWVLLYAKQGSDYLMLDPWPYPCDTQPVTLLSRFSQGQSLARTIKAVAWYRCSAGASIPGGPATPPASTTPSTPQPAPVETNMFLQVGTAATAGLRLHPQPAQDSPAVAAEMPGTLLQVIEDPATAQAKIGVNGQWIYVRDPNGLQGYVSGFYVQLASAPAPAPSQPTVPATPSPGPVTPPTSTPSTPPAPSTPPPPASSPQRLMLVVLQSVGPYGLRLRAAPSLGGSLVAIEKAGKFLTVIEPPDMALSKIGVPNQWINVRDPNGLRGYVMATYVGQA